MSWWIAAALVWLGTGFVTALAIGRATRGAAPDLRSLVDGLERENQGLWDELERVTILGRSGTEPVAAGGEAREGER